MSRCTMAFESCKLIHLQLLNRLFRPASTRIPEPPVFASQASRTFINYVWSYWLRLTQLISSNCIRFIIWVSLKVTSRFQRYLSAERSENACHSIRNWNVNRNYLPSSTHNGSFCCNFDAKQKLFLFLLNKSFFLLHCAYFGIIFFVTY